VSCGLRNHHDGLVCFPQAITTLTSANEYYVAFLDEGFDGSFSTVRTRDKVGGGEGWGEMGVRVRR
jgi:hypothetical protein